MPYYLKHKYFVKVAACFVLLSATAIWFPISAQPTGLTLKFSEEFDTPINFLKWSPHPPGRLSLNGIQMFTPEAIAISGGQAHITAKKTATGYSSGILTTFGSFSQTYGRFEIRFRIPKGAGLEPLVQLLPVPAGEAPSIDLVNAIGNDPANVLFANRWIENKLDHEYTGSWKATDLSNGFHTIAVDWDEEKIVWLIDGAERFRSEDGIPNQPMYLALSLMVGTSNSGPPAADTKFPATFDIDYIRIYSRP